MGDRDDDPSLDTIPIRRGGAAMAFGLVVLLAATVTLAFDRVWAGGAFCLSGVLFAVSGRVPSLGFGLANGSDQQEKLIARIVGVALLLSGIYLLLTPEG